MRLVLPVDAIVADLVQALAHSPQVVVAPPGSGKTTRLPPALLDLPGQVWVVQPRRVAARAVARRVAEEQGVNLGEEVGYAVRGDDRRGPRTRLAFVTEGILLRRLQSDPFLEGISALVFDEFHERRLDSDLALALAREVRAEARPDLRLLVMSATLDPTPVASWLGGGVLQAEGRAYPVEIEHLALPDPRPVAEQVASAIRRSLDPEGGDSLAFLPGVAEIRAVARALGELPGRQVLELHGSLPPEAQDRALRPSGPAVVLSTNLAETSVTLPGVTRVIDAGWVKRAWLDPSTGLDRLATERVSAASADQRAGRAGRVRPGRALRLWTLREHDTLRAQEPPEVRRVDLTAAVLQLRCWGADPERFGWYEAPEPERLAAAERVLTELGAWVDGSVTPLGRVLSELPLSPRLGRLVVAAHRRGASEVGAAAALALSEGYRPRPAPDQPPASSDLWGLADQVLQGPLREQARHLARLARQQLGPAPPGDPEEALLRAAAEAWPDRVALRRAPGSPRARLVRGRGVALGPDSRVTEAPLFVAISLDDAAEGPRSEARVFLASAVEPAWLTVEEREDVIFDPVRELARAVRRRVYRDLILSEASAAGDPAALADCLAEAAGSRLQAVLPDDPALQRLRARLAFLAELAPEAGLPDGGEAWLRSLLPELCAGRRSLEELRRAPWREVAERSLGAGRARLDREAPDRLEVPSGSWIPVDYNPRPPVLAARIQELFGWQAAPRLAGGKVPIRLHLLGPNRVAVQVTDDLAGFWDRTWPEVRRELRGRYPRHAWPEDPRQHPALRGPKPRGGG